MSFSRVVRVTKTSSAMRKSFGKRCCAMHIRGVLLLWGAVW
jgi:hypothetical protein